MFAHNAKCKNVQSCLNMLKHDYVSKSCLEFSEYNVRGFLSSKKSAIEPPFHIEPEDESEWLCSHVMMSHGKIFTNMKS